MQSDFKLCTTPDAPRSMYGFTSICEEGESEERLYLHIYRKRLTGGEGGGQHLHATRPPGSFHASCCCGSLPKKKEEREKGMCQIKALK